MRARVVPRDRRPTIRHVATRAGVSVGTVSNVLNDDTPVSEARRAAVLDAIAALGFRPSESGLDAKPSRSPPEERTATRSELPPRSAQRNAGLVPVRCGPTSAASVVISAASCPPMPELGAGMSGASVVHS